ncbi:hypothetical protein EVG20_g6116 [Dentipellis fragilis]|uniref:Uncharacterized protein n=1 Tax=Dentipellis fragilis TaxID=205917 RepID=A0A4Y9YP65_9AGAM|nr:hypothetical protein EVG20_g6116 [Dentipellis fragilis]
MGLSLRDFTQQGLTSIYTASEPEDIERAFDAFVSPNAEIHVNDKQISREDFKKLVSRNSLITNVSVEFPNAIDVPKKGAQGEALAGPEVIIWS